MKPAKRQQLKISSKDWLRLEKLLNKKNYDHSWFFATRFMKKEVKSIKKKITDLYFEQIINCNRKPNSQRRTLYPPPQPKKKKDRKKHRHFSEWV